VNALLSRPSR